jgi:O-antigen/teichoic acid export membrane protein
MSQPPPPRPPAPGLMDQTIPTPLTTAATADAATLPLAPGRAATPAPPGGSLEGLGHRAAGGVLWYAAQTVAVKVLTVGGQIALSWLLVRKDYGYVGLAYTISTFVGLIQLAGTREVLVQRSRRFNLWAGAGFWLALFSGVLGALLMLAAAPLAARFYHEPRVQNLIILLGIGGLIGSLSAVPDAKLQSEMRFRLLATSNFVLGAFSMCLSVVLAVLGFGAYSFVIPFPVTVTLRTVFLWVVAHPHVPLHPRFKRMKYLLSDSGLMLLSTFLLLITLQIDYITLGRMYSQDQGILGLYYWAFNLSLQSIYLFAESMAGVLFPSLSRLNAEPARQRDAFFRAARMIALLAIPACVAQIVLAPPIIHLAFKSQWFDGIVLVQILSMGMAFYAVGSQAYAALKAKGRFGFLSMLLAALAVLATAMVYVGARSAAALGTAIAIAVYLFIFTMVTTSIVLRGGGGRVWRDVLRIFAAPLFCSAAAGGAALAVGSVLPHQTKPQWSIVAVVSGVVMAGIYLPLARLLARQTWDEFSNRIRQLLSRSRATPAAVVTPS